MASALQRCRLAPHGNRRIEVERRMAWRELSSRHSRAGRHPPFVRITHWITAACVGALFVNGLSILVAHPRLYWGEAGGFCRLTSRFSCGGS